MIEFRKLLRLLAESDLDFVVVGGVAATLHGVAEPTRDLDVCIRLSPESWKSVEGILRPLNPRFALTPDRRPIPFAELELQRFKNLYVVTDIGRIDFLGEVPPLGAFEEVASTAQEIRIDDFSVTVISLDELIRVKEHVRRPKDLEVAIELRAIRDRLKSK